MGSSKIKRLVLGNYKSNKITSKPFPETEAYEKGFAEHYNSFIVPHVKSFEEKRIEALDISRKTFFRCLFFFPLALILMLFLYFLKISLNIDWTFISAVIAPLYCAYVFIYIIYHFIFGRNKEKDDEEAPKFLKWHHPLAIIFLSLFLLLIAFVNVLVLIAYPLISGFLIYLPIFLYKSDIKENIFPNIISFLESYIYKQYADICMKTYKYAQIVPSFNNQLNEDYLKGSYKGVQIEMFESCLTKKHDDTTKVVFDGIVISLSMNKKFNGHTIVKTNNGKIRSALTSAFSNLKRVTLEDPEFEDLFDVFSTNQIEARCLLTTAFMQRLLDLTDKFESTGLQASFYKQNLLLMIPMEKDLFEPGSIFAPQDFIVDCKSFLSEIHLIHQIVHILKLDNDIGM